MSDVLLLMILLRFTKQFFIDASSLQTLITAFKNIAISLEIGTTFEEASLWLASQIEEWILLFDNADDPAIDLFHFFPKCTHGNIIITSRNPQLVTHAPRSNSKVGDMDETNAIDLLLLRAVQEKTMETTERASKIVKVFYLRHPPLPIHIDLAYPGTILSAPCSHPGWCLYFQVQLSPSVSLHLQTESHQTTGPAS
jgi:hypothetical protein